MKERRIPLFNLAILFTMSLFGQDTAGDIAQIDISTGLIQYGNTDEYISKTRYSGSCAPLSIHWNHFKEGRGFHLGLDITDISDLENSDIPNLGASILDFKLPVNHYYRLGSAKLSGKEISIYIGPGYGMHVYERKQNVAQGGSQEQKVSSFLLQFPLRLNSRVYFPLNEKWEITGETGLNILTASLRSDLSDEFDAQVLALNKNFEMLFYLTLKYRLIDRILVFTSFKNRLTYITGVDQDLHMGQTGGELGLSFNLKRKR